MRGQSRVTSLGRMNVTDWLRNHKLMIMELKPQGTQCWRAVRELERGKGSKRKS